MVYRPRLMTTLAFLAIILPVEARAELKVPSLFNHRMVLQRQQPLRIWGWADPGEEVEVTLAGQRLVAIAEPDRRWQVELHPLPAGGPHTLQVKGRNQALTIQDVLVGEVWLCSGQSNMDWSFRRKVLEGPRTIASATHPRIRLFQVARAANPKRQGDCTGTWQVCTPQSVKSFSALAYFFGRELHQKLKVPVGLIKSSWGGTRVEAWTSPGALDRLPAAAPLLGAWQKAIERAKEKGKARLVGHRHRPGNLYNGMIAPLAPLAIRGVIWYQGEANVTRAHQYRRLFPCLIQDWRHRFRQAALPFGFVQLAPFRYKRNRVQALPELWESQLLTLRSMAHVGMVVTTDIATVNNIHPPNKLEVGRRLALWARARVYGEKDLVYSGPIYTGWSRQGRAITVTFDHVAGGLKTSDGKAPSHFTIAGTRGRFHPAQARIEGNKVVLTSQVVKRPAAVRFAWSDTAQPNLVNSAGLPASPFRTDSWPGVTIDRVSPF